MSVNVVIVGHIDHGKSTLIGRLLYDSAALPEGRLAEMQKLIEEYKKRFEFAYFLDSFEEELMEERTIDTTRILFKGKSYYTIVDVPGHQEFIKNMLTGASHAQVAILVVSCVDGIQEQTRRHTFLVNMLGIKDIIVAINKMDMVDYQKPVFDRLRERVSNLLASLGYSGNTFIPISAMEGDNIYKPSTRMDWHHGPTLIQALDKIELEEVEEKPLRFAVQNTYFVNSEKVVVGRVESGILRRGAELVFQPSGVEGRVDRIKGLAGEVEETRVGDSISIVVECKPQRGDVGGQTGNPPTLVDSFLGEVVLLEGTLQSGDEFEMKCGTKRTKCSVQRIKERISSETGEVLERNAGKIEKSEAATVVFRTEPMVIERFAEIPELGRFILARNGKNIGAGVVLEVNQ